ncbi:SRPBCC domain-containing protein [Humibacter sp. RRB41]|uniref:SRPBCC family protein n=1 Tax=Humibacter sp. RRB41 TaxID=2919946 RepID=UPI001FA9E96F|nr:SRPBCC domain-containing protein [Humibacter sp. RRB41]
MTERIERIVTAPPTRVWELWTTADGISKWWAPEGFRTDVTRLELQPGGELDYTMTAVGQQQVAFMEQNGMPLATESRKYFTEIAEPTRLAYRSVIDFVPDHEPYEQLTEITLEPVADGTRIVMDVEPLHDEVWTGRLLAGRANELDNLAALVSAE